MPQVKGNASWLTNVRQEVPRQKVGIDESKPRMKNTRMDSDLDEELDRLHLEQYRRLVDTRFELQDVKEEVDKWQTMQTVITMPKGLCTSAVNTRQSSSKLSIPDDSGSVHTDQTILTKNGSTLSLDNNIFEVADKPPRAKTASVAALGTQKRNIYPIQEHVFQNRHSSQSSSDSGSVNSEPRTHIKPKQPLLQKRRQTVEVMEFINLPSRLRPFSSVTRHRLPSPQDVESSERTSIACGMSSAEHGFSKKRRPKTAGSVRSRIRNAGNIDVGDALLNNRPASFAELKNSTNIDNVCLRKGARKADVVNHKHMQSSCEKVALQIRIDNFCRNIEEFKRSTDEDATAASSDVLPIYEGTKINKG